MSRKLTDKDKEFIIANRLDYYPCNIAVALELKEYQVRGFLKEQGLDYKRKYGVVRGFTPREEEIYNLLMEGYTLQEIADTTFSSRATIATHCNNIMRKKMVDTRIQLMAQRIQELEEEINNIRQTLNSSTQT